MESGRRKLPTWSARNGGFVFFMGESFGFGAGRRRFGHMSTKPSRDGGDRQPQNNAMPARAAGNAGGNWPIMATDAMSMPAGTAAIGGGGYAEILLQGGAIGLQRGAVALVHDAAALEDHGAVGDAENLLGILLDHDRRGPLLPDHPLERHQQFLHEDRREPLQRLVQQQDARIEDEG